MVPVAYRAYCVKSGKNLPAWEDLDDADRRGWSAAVFQVATAVRMAVVILPDFATAEDPGALVPRIARVD